jgi:stearoyl-CoA desaturase (Delta-9 desaturase)
MALPPLVVSLPIAIVLTQVAKLSTTNYLHRCATHHALTLHPAIAWRFRLALWITTGLATKEWVAVHRKQHAFTDEDGDPHSPRLNGFRPVQLGKVFYYVRERSLSFPRLSELRQYRHEHSVARAPHRW